MEVVRMRGWTLAVLLGVFGAGALVGVAGERLWHRQHRPRHGLHGHLPTRPGEPHRRPPAERFVEDLTREVGLNAEQEAAVRSILDDAEQRALDVMKASHPALEAVRVETRGKVLEVLDPTQRAAYEALEQKRPPPAFGPPRRPGEGGPPAPPDGPPPDGPPPDGPPPGGPPG